eukprot:7952750-Alexandrium_andersonii.AAC.1
MRESSLTGSVDVLRSTAAAGPGMGEPMAHSRVQQMTWAPRRKRMPFAVNRRHWKTSWKLTTRKPPGATVSFSRRYPSGGP